MRTDKFSKTNLILYACGLIPVIWLALLVAPYLDGGLVEIIKNLSVAFSNPFNISFCEDSVKTVLICILAYALGIGIYLSNDKNYRRREEHGSAKWGKPATIKKKYMDAETTKNKVLTQNTAIGLDGRQHRRNLNVLVCGGSGAGKTRFYAKPNIMQANTSFIVLDPKGELLRDTGGMLEKHGYDILTKQLGLKNVIKTYDLVLNNKSIDLQNVFHVVPELNIPDIKLNSIAIIPNQQNSKFGNEQEVLNIYKDIIEKMISKGKNVYILRHSKMDLPICQKIAKLNSNAILLENEFSCVEFNNFVNKFDFVIASRFHSVVHAYKNAVPCITLGWAVKYLELHNLFMQDNFVFNVRENMDRDAILSAIEYMDNNFKSESDKISLCLRDVQKENVFDILSLE